MFGAHKIVAGAIIHRSVIFWANEVLPGLKTLIFGGKNSLISGKYSCD